MDDSEGLATVDMVKIRREEGGRRRENGGERGRNEDGLGVRDTSEDGLLQGRAVPLKPEAGENASKKQGQLALFSLPLFSPFLPPLTTDWTHKHEDLLCQLLPFRIRRLPLRSPPR